MTQLLASGLHGQDPLKECKAARTALDRAYSPYKMNLLPTDVTLQAICKYDVLDAIGNLLLAIMDALPDKPNDARKLWPNAENSAVEGLLAMADDVQTHVKNYKIAALLPYADAAAHWQFAHYITSQDEWIAYNKKDPYRSNQQETKWDAQRKTVQELLVKVGNSRRATEESCAFRAAQHQNYPSAVGALASPYATQRTCAAFVYDVKSFNKYNGQRPVTQDTAITDINAKLAELSAVPEEARSDEQKHTIAMYKLTLEFLPKTLQELSAIRYTDL